MEIKEKGYHFDAESSYIKNGRRYVMCTCRCGNIIEKRLDHVQRKHNSHCGCLNHRKVDEPIYHVWASMLARCKNKKNQAYKNYGGRGISVCPEWESFVNFWNDMRVDYQRGLTLDRIDNNGNYCRENCRWATRTEQSRNTRRNVWIESNGRKMLAIDWCKELGRSYQAVRQRVSEGKTYKQALHL